MLINESYDDFSQVDNLVFRPSFNSSAPGNLPSSKAL